MNSILIVMFVFICGLIILLMHQISRLMEMQEDLKEQHDTIRTFIFSCHRILLKSEQIADNKFPKVESSLHDIDRNIGILHTFLEEYTDTILKAIGSNNGDIDAISSYLEIMKNTILDMNDKMNIPTYGGEVNDTEEADLIPENWTDTSPTLHVYYAEDDNI